MSQNPPPVPRVAVIAGWQGWVRRGFLFAALWWVLTDGAPDGWIIGIPVILLATWLSLKLWSKFPLSLPGVLRFVPWFAFQSVAGATDVALRAMRPNMPLHPGLVRHPLRLPRGASRVTLANVVSMLPGTLSADLEGDELVIHALDTRTDLDAMVRDLEPRIAGVFGLRLEDQAREDAA